MSTPRSTKSEAFDFEDFSDEIILKVVSYLNSNDRFKCSFTSKRLRAICQDHTLPSIWQKIHLYNPNLILETSKNPMATFGKYLSTEMNIEKHLQSTTWKHVKWPCENGLQNCGKINNNLKQSNLTKSYLNLNIENFDDQILLRIYQRPEYTKLYSIKYRSSYGVVCLTSFLWTFSLWSWSSKIK